MSNKAGRKVLQMVNIQRSTTRVQGELNWLMQVFHVERTETPVMEIEPLWNFLFFLYQN